GVDLVGPPLRRLRRPLDVAEGGPVRAAVGEDDEVAEEPFAAEGLEAEAGAGEAAEEGDVGEEEEGVEGDVLGLDAVAGVAAVEPEPLARAAVLDRVERDDALGGVVAVEEGGVGGLDGGGGRGLGHGARVSWCALRVRPAWRGTRSTRRETTAGRESGGAGVLGEEGVEPLDHPAGLRLQGLPVAAAVGEALG